jgi:4-amino-4-deoxy-L-arabinose transferase-like glycosyltransferase
MQNRTTNILATLMLIVMLGLSFAEMRGDSQTMDEVSHLPAGYSYVTQKDMRINPEHPPLIKDMAGLSVWLWSKVSGTHINFPSNIKAWKEEINSQWDYGFAFMYGSSNNADKMLFYGRLPMLLILLLLGFYVFKWSKELFGNKGALLALFLFAFSPTFIAHGHLVTTDVAAAAAVFISLYYFIRWLKIPTAKNLIIAGIIFGLALLAKFSTFLLAPLFVFLAIIWLILKREEGWGAGIWRYIGGLILIMIIGVAVIYPVYLYHTWNYPISHQVNDIDFILNPYASGKYSVPFGACKKLSPITCAAEVTEWMASKPVLRPWAQYSFGFLMVFQRATGGNTTYFLGEVSNNGWKDYFPIVYAIKEPLAMHILTILALITALYSIAKAGAKNIFSRLGNWLENHIAEFGMIGFLAIYWITSLSSNLNIGVRHLLPTFPLVYVLVSEQISKWFKPRNQTNGITKSHEKTSFATLKRAGGTLVLVLFAWQAYSVISVYPNFLSYFNELVGGPANAYKYVVDSNLDWGQDMKRLANWTAENNINAIYVDYFGGTDPVYYLGDKFKQWHSDYDPSQMPPGSYLAVSATFLQNDLGRRVGAINSEPGDFYYWIKQYKPVATIGNSIFVYRIP